MLFKPSMWIGQVWPTSRARSYSLSGLRAVRYTGLLSPRRKRKFAVLYCFFVIDHDRRRILHLNVTQNPSAPWVALQLRQTWAYDQRQRFLIFDRDAKFNADVVATVEDYGMRPMRTALPSPWQNFIAERWVGSVRPDLLDHVIVVNQRHLRRLMKNYIRYYQEDRTHLGLGKDTPGGRVAASASPIGSKVISWPRLGGLHHRCAAAA